MYITLFLLITAGGIWLNRSIHALALYHPNFIIPLLQVLWMVCATMNGGIFFQEEPQSWAGFLFGIFVILGGVVGLSQTGVGNNSSNSEMPNRARAPSDGDVDNAADA